LTVAFDLSARTPCDQRLASSTSTNFDGQISLLILEKNASSITTANYHDWDWMKLGDSDTLKITRISPNVNKYSTNEIQFYY